MTGGRERVRLAGAVVAIVVGLSAAGAAYAQADLVGEWRSRSNEDLSSDPDIGAYEGLPINDRARHAGKTWSASLWTVPEHQCIPHPADYGANFSNVRISKIVDPLTQEIIAYQTNVAWMNPTRTIWMDGRPHPGPNALHTWEGFSTGKWEGDVLVVTTTHMKQGYPRRNGLPRSANGVLVEHFIRVGDVLTWVSHTEDPAYLDEPYVKSISFYNDPGYQVTVYPCSTDVEIVRPEGEIPHYVTQNPDLYEYGDKHGLTHEAVMGGVATEYPEFMAKLPTTGAPAAPAAGSKPAQTTRGADRR